MKTSTVWSRVTRTRFIYRRRRFGIIFKTANREHSENASEREDPHRRESSQQNYGKQNQSKTKRTIINNWVSGRFVGANTARMHESYGTMRLRAVTAGKREQVMQSSLEFLCIGVCPLALCGEIPSPVQEVLFLRVRSSEGRREGSERMGQNGCRCGFMWGWKRRGEALGTGGGEVPKTKTCIHVAGLFK